MSIDEFDSVALLVPLPAERLFPSELPAGEGLRPGDEGVVVDALHAPEWYTVEFFRGGETVAIADVTPAQVRVVARAAPTMELSHVRHAD